MADGRVPAWRSEHPAIRWGAYAWAFVGMALTFVIVWRGLGYVRIVVVPFTVAVFLAAILTPLARRLEERGVPPAGAALAALAAFVVAIGTLGYLVTLSIQAELDDLTEQAHQTYREVAPHINQLPFIPPADQLFGEVTPDGEGAGEDGGQENGQEATESSVTTRAQDAAVATIRSTGLFLTEFFLFLVVTFFYIKDRRRIARFATGLFARAQREHVAQILLRTWQTVGGYIRGQAIIAAIDGLFVGIGLFIAGIPLAGVLGVIVFLGAFVPVVGSIVAGMAAVGVGLASQGLAGGLIALAIVVVVQQLEGHLLAPVILSRAVEIHPIAVLAAVTAGAVLLGVWGAIIGVPLAASLYRAAGYLRDEADIDGVEQPPP